MKGLRPVVEQFWMILVEIFTAKLAFGPGTPMGCLVGRVRRSNAGSLVALPCGAMLWNC